MTTKLPPSPRIDAPHHPRRRRRPPWLAGLLLACGTIPAAADESFSYDAVVDKARKLAQPPYQAPEKVPDFLRELDYDAHRALRFDPEQSPWPGHNFRIQFFAPGFLHQETVAINLVEADGMREAPFSPGMFDYGDRPGLEEKMPEDLGFAGFRLHYTADSPPERANSKHDEFLVFLGASYYRLKGLRQEYGLSARGAAIDTGLDVPEEFPRFREFWIERPAPDAHAVTVYALLDSHALTGAYRFTAYPGGSGSVVDVKATLFMRHNVTKLGLAPLTSMFMYGVGDHRPPRFLRPAVHDSDGLLLHLANDEWLWRPLSNPEAVTVDLFRADNLKGFGLLQRDREYDHYQSPSMEYQNRPSAWIAPKGDWGPGHVELVQLPIDDEWHDNIVAFWKPAEQPEPNQPLHLAYRMRAAAQGPEQPLAHVSATRTADGREAGVKSFRVEFTGPELMALPHDADIKTEVSFDRGQLHQVQLAKDDTYGVWRVTLKTVPEPGQPQHLRLRLTHEGRTLTETWDYIHRP